MSEAEQIAAKLTGELRASVLDNCSCGHAADLVELGLWKPDPKLGAPYYISTQLGLQVRQILQGDQ